MMNLTRTGSSFRNKFRPTGSLRLLLEILFAQFVISFFLLLFLAFQDVQTNRTLTLISKTIQSLGNLVSSRSAQQHAKEEFTVELYKKFCTEKHVNAVKRFLDAISTNEPVEFDGTIEAKPILLKDG